MSVSRLSIYKALAISSGSGEEAESLVLQVVEFDIAMAFSGC